MKANLTACISVLMMLLTDITSAQQLCEVPPRREVAYNYLPQDNSLTFDFDPPPPGFRHELTILLFLSEEECLSLGSGNSFQAPLEELQGCLFQRDDPSGSTSLLGSMLISTYSDIDNCKLVNNPERALNYDFKCFEVGVQSQVDVRTGVYSTPSKHVCVSLCDTPDVEIASDVQIDVSQQPEFLGDVMEIVVRQKSPTDAIQVRIVEATVVPVFGETLMPSASVQIVEGGAAVEPTAFLSDEGRRLSFGVPRTGYYNFQLQVLVEVILVGFSGGVRLLLAGARREEARQEEMFELPTMEVSDKHITSFSYKFDPPLSGDEYQNNELALRVATAQACGARSLSHVELTPVTQTEVSDQVSEVRVQVTAGKVTLVHEPTVYAALSRYVPTFPAAAIEGVHTDLEDPVDPSLPASPDIVNTTPAPTDPVPPTPPESAPAIPDTPAPTDPVPPTPPKSSPAIPEDAPEEIAPTPDTGSSSRAVAPWVVTAAGVAAVCAALMV